MSVFHHRAQLLRNDGNEATYRYFPDTAIDASCCGEFVVSVPTWSFEIVHSANAEARVNVTTDVQCVGRLVEKMRKHFEAELKLPEDVLWLA
jgi:hypothetical protein